VAEYVKLVWREPTAEEIQAEHERVIATFIKAHEILSRGPNRPFGALVIDTNAWQRQLDTLSLAGDVWSGEDD
jgi:hypothetical protein